MNSIASELPDYDQTNAAMEIAGLDASAAEVHGTICGVIASPNGESTDWLAAVLGGDRIEANDLPKELSAQLLAMFQISRSALKNEDFSFSLLIPKSDDHDIANRTESVAAWCRGFLLGLSAGGLKEFASLPDAMREALEDMLNIAEVVAQEGEDEELERALMELEEYVRVAAQFIFNERQHMTAMQ